MNDQQDNLDRSAMPPPEVKPQKSGLFQKGTSQPSTGRRTNQVMTYAFVLGILALLLVFMFPHGGGKKQGGTSSDDQSSFAHPADAATLSDRATGDETTATGGVIAPDGNATDAVHRLEGQLANFNDDGTMVKADGSNLGPAGQKLPAGGGEPVPGGSGAPQPASPTAPPMTPEQRVALERQAALESAGTQSMHVLGGGGTSATSAPQPQTSAGDPAPDVSPSTVPPSALAYAGLQFAHDNAGPLPAEFASGNGYDQGGQSTSSSVPADDGVVAKFSRHRAPSVCPMDAGTVIPYVIDTGYNSETGGLIVGHVPWNLMDSSNTCMVMPLWTKVLLRGDPVAAGVSRIPARVEFFIYPDHSYSVFPGAVATDLNGTTGMTPSSRNDHRGSVIGTSVLTAGLTALPLLFGGGPWTVANGVATQSPSQAYMSALAAQLSANGGKLVEQKLAQPPTLEANPHKIYGIIIEKTIPFDGPYQAWDQ